MKLLVLNGPNLNLLGFREPEKYGREDYLTVVDKIIAYGQSIGVDVEVRQSNHEGTLIDWIQGARGQFDGIVFNPAAYTHTSIALMDALLAVAIPTVEIHITDISVREDFRQISYVRQAAIDCVMGKGTDGYMEAIDILVSHLGGNV